MKKNLVQHYVFNGTADINSALMFDTEEKIKEFLTSKFTSGACFGMDNLARSGIYKYMGILYDFQPWLKKYLVQMGVDGTFYAKWAPSKAQLRTALYLSRKDKVYFFPKK